MQKAGIYIFTSESFYTADKVTLQRADAEKNQEDKFETMVYTVCLSLLLRSKFNFYTHANGIFQGFTETQYESINC